MIKRALDLTIASVGLLTVSPLLAAIALLIRFDSPGPVLFRQTRIGRGFQPFRMLKFRTMVHDASHPGASITVGQDPRITRFGRILRRTKMDELPQLMNVIQGDMSLVGPRPEVPHYVDMFRDDYEEILRVRPGITDLASIRYYNEAALLAGAADPEEEYIRHVLPEKIALAKEYVATWSVLFDLKVIARTIYLAVWPGMSR